MNCTTTSLLFLVTVCGAILGLLGEADAIWLFLTVLAIPLALALGAYLILERKFYTAVLFCAHFAMYVFAVFVFINRDRVIETPYHDFSVFTDDNLRTALLALSITVALIACVPLALGKRAVKDPKLELVRFVSQTFGRLAFWSLEMLQCMLLMSCLGAIGICLLATTVLQVPYPYNGAGRWVPGFVLLSPTGIGLVVLGAAHARQLMRHGSYLGSLLSLARVNFVVSPVLCLLVVGSRGFTTFMWIMAAGLEFYSARKRRATMICGLLFLFLGYYAYSAWPFLRWNLATMETGPAVVTGFEYALRMKGNEETSDLVDLETYPMVGESLFHLLYVIELEKMGNSLAGSTFINLVAQALPEFLDGVLWERPLNDNWKIPFKTGGGFFSAANAYWNGGMGVMAVFVLFISAASLYFDQHLQKDGISTVYKCLYFIYMPLVIVQLFYGIQGLVRPFEAFALVVVLEKLLVRNPLPRSAGGN